MAKPPGEFLRGDLLRIKGQDSLGVPACGVLMLFGYVKTENRSSASPVTRRIEGPVRSNCQAGVTASSFYGRLFLEFEVGPLFNKTEDPDLSLLVGHEEAVTEIRRKGGSGVGSETAGPRAKISDGGCEVGSVVIAVGEEEALVHPGIVGGDSADPGEILFAQPLPVEAPSMLAPFGDVEGAFLLSRVVPVVIHAEEVAVCVEGQFLGIALAGGVALDLGSIQFTAEDSAAVGSVVGPPLRGPDVVPLVPERPVDPAVGSEGHSAHVVSALAHVHLETGGYDFTGIGKSVSIRIMVAKKIWFRRHEDI